MWTADTAKEIGERIGIDWGLVAFEPIDLARGMEIELEHGSRFPAANVTDDDEELTAKIAWAHLEEHPKYYEYLASMEELMQEDSTEEELVEYAPEDES